MDRKETMRTITAGAPHVVVMERSDGYVGFAASRSPNDYLVAVSKHAIIERTEVRPVMHSESVVEQLCGGFEFDPGNRWGPIDFDRAIAELNAFDPLTGDRHSLDYFVRGDRVWVKGAGKGRIRAFTHSGRFVVELDEMIGGATRLEAPRSLVKPLLRADQVGAMEA